MCMRSTGRCWINMRNPGTPSVFPSGFIYMKGLQLERNPMKVNRVITLGVSVLFKTMKRFSLERSSMNISHVGHSSEVTVM